MIKLARSINAIKINKIDSFFFGVCACMWIAVRTLDLFSSVWIFNFKIAKYTFFIDIECLFALIRICKKHKYMGTDQSFTCMGACEQCTNTDIL